MIKGKKGDFRGYQEAIRKYKHSNTRLCEPWKDDKVRGSSEEPLPFLKSNGKITGHSVICNRTDNLTKHHIVPNSIYKNSKTCNMCIWCHSELHSRFSNAELYSNGNSIEKIARLLVAKDNTTMVTRTASKVIPEPHRKFVVKETRRHYVLYY